MRKLTTLNRIKKSSRSSRQKPQLGDWGCEDIANFHNLSTQRTFLSPSLSLPLPNPRTLVLLFFWALKPAQNCSAAIYSCSLQTTFLDSVKPPWLELQVQATICFSFDLVNINPNLNNTHLYIYPASIRWQLVFKHFCPQYFFSHLIFKSVLFLCNCLQYQTPFIMRS